MALPSPPTITLPYPVNMVSCLNMTYQFMTIYGVLSQGYPCKWEATTFRPPISATVDWRSAATRLRRSCLFLHPVFVYLMIKWVSPGSICNWLNSSAQRLAWVPPSGARRQPSSTRRDGCKPGNRAGGPADPDQRSGETPHRPRTNALSADLNP